MQTKVEIAREIMQKNPGVRRKDLIGMLMDKADLTHAGASTYIHNIRHGNAKGTSETRRPGRPRKDSTVMPALTPAQLTEAVKNYAGEHPDIVMENARAIADSPAFSNAKASSRRTRKAR
jgi:hypothetical protein